MPQEFRVLQCYSCETFQVDIVKKIPKWVCKMCGVNQSVIKVFGSGPAKNCRLFVQEMNIKRGYRLDENAVEFPECLVEEVAEVTDSYCKDDLKNPNFATTSKWVEFLEESPATTCLQQIRNLDPINCNKYVERTHSQEKGGINESSQEDNKSQLIMDYNLRSLESGSSNKNEFKKNMFEHEGELDLSL